MTSQSHVNSFVLALDDFDRSQLPVDAQTPGTEAFTSAVTRYFQREYANFGGFVRVVVGPETIEVVWNVDPSRPDPMDIALQTLQRGDRDQAKRLLMALHRHRSHDFIVLYNLGLILSDDGETERAEELLRRASEVRPHDADTLVALGVAVFRQQRIEDARDLLRKALRLDPANLWGHRNLGICLMKLGQYSEAEVCFRRLVESYPNDQDARFWLAKLLLTTDRIAEADACLQDVIRQDAQSPVAKAAQEERSRLAERTFRGTLKGMVRPDAVMYLVGALEKFDTMTPNEIRDIGFEIALLGQLGLDVNDSTQKYHLNRLPGKYSGLHLLCYMYVAFQRVMPGDDIGFDLSAEFAVAKSLFGGNQSRKEQPDGDASG